MTLTTSPVQTDAKPPAAAAPHQTHALESLERNPGLPLDLNWLASFRVNRSAAERRASTQTKRRSVKKRWQAAWQIKAISCIDLTTLAGDDTEGRVRRLCAKARQPVRQDVLAELGLADFNLRVAAVCVYHRYIETARRALEGSGVPVCAVSTGFPAGLSPAAERLREIASSIALGAEEIDIVITRAYVLQGNWAALYDEVRSFREACGDAHMKAILATGELATLENVGRASLVAMMAGADFVKTSTGKEVENATLPVSLIMARTIREYFERTGFRIGFKPAGGISKAKQSVDWLALMKDELGRRWLEPDLFRFGASSLLGDLERQLEHYVTGAYSASFRHPMS